MGNIKAAKIEIWYDDGSHAVADGDAANAIMNWYGSCEQLAWLHGSNYTGPKMLKIYPEHPEPPPAPAHE